MDLNPPSGSGQCHTRRSESSPHQQWHRPQTTEEDGADQMLSILSQPMIHFFFELCKIIIQKLRHTTFGRLMKKRLGMRHLAPQGGTKLGKNCRVSYTFRSGSRSRLPHWQKWQNCKMNFENLNETHGEHNVRSWPEWLRAWILLGTECELLQTRVPFLPSFK